MRASQGKPLKQGKFVAIKNSQSTNTEKFGIMVILEYKKIIRNNVWFVIVCGGAVITGLVLCVVGQ